MRSIQLWNHRQPSQSIARKPYIVSSAEVSIVGDEKNPISTDWLGNLNIFNAFNGVTPFSWTGVRAPRRADSKSQHGLG